MTDAKDQLNETLSVTSPDVAELKKAIRDLLLSVDASWTGGHDWNDAVERAKALIGLNAPIDGRVYDPTETTPERARSATEGDKVENLKEALEALRTPGTDPVVWKLDRKWPVIFALDAACSLVFGTEPGTSPSHLQTVPESAGASKPETKWVLADEVYREDRLRDRIRDLEAEVEKLREEYHNCAKFATQYEEQKHRHRDEVKNLRHEMMLQTSAVERANRYLEAALEKVITRSHSWVIKEETAYIEAPIHESYRKIAKEALNEHLAR